MFSMQKGEMTNATTYDHYIGGMVKSGLNVLLLPTLHLMRGEEIECLLVCFGGCIALFIS